jgi:CBS-domain-containing membrane protein
MLAVGGTSLLAGQPWLFPSLGPTALVEIEYPAHRSARIYNVIVGHLSAMIAGFFAVILLGAQRLPMALVRPTPSRVLAAAIAISLTLAATRLLRASHPPAASTTLVVALGGFAATWHDAATIVAGVVLVAIVGRGLRRVRVLGRRRDRQHRERSVP